MTSRAFPNTTDTGKANMSRPTAAAWPPSRTWYALAALHPCQAAWIGSGETWNVITAKLLDLQRRLKAHESLIVRVCRSNCDTDLAIDGVAVENEEHSTISPHDALQCQSRLTCIVLPPKRPRPHVGDHSWGHVQGVRNGV